MCIRDRLSAANRSEFNLTGAVVVGLLLHMVVTTGLSASIEGRRRAMDRFVTNLVTGAFLLAMVPLISVAITVVSNGMARLDSEFFNLSLIHI